MEIHILAASMLPKFIPKRETIAMRIFDSGLVTPSYPKILLNHPLYSAEFEYRFDDIDTVSNPYTNDEEFLGDFVLFNKNFARKAIEDFRSVYDSKKEQDLLVHCFLGESRSPAMASGLNDIFNLVRDTLNFEYPKMNKRVYLEMVSMGRELGFLK